MDVDKVDIIASSYATNMIAPAMPIVMQHDARSSRCSARGEQRVQLQALLLDDADRRPRPKESFAEGFFEVAAEQTPKPLTVAMCGADAEFRATPWTARATSSSGSAEVGLRQDLSADHRPITRRSCARSRDQPDIFLACSYPADTVGLIRASHEVGFKP
jgi:branched-chain amino acid transport system substrate-binding protein